MLDKIIDITRLERFLINIKEYIANVLLTKQDSLISGTNIKTINGETILGNGNIVCGSKPIQVFTDTSIELNPNVYYRKTNQSSSLSITLGPEITDGLNEYFVEFSTASTGTTIALPANIKWANGENPTFDPNTTYQISIVNNLGVCIKFS